MDLFSLRCINRYNNKENRGNFNNKKPKQIVRNNYIISQTIPSKTFRLMKGPPSPRLQKDVNTNQNFF